MSRVTTNLAQVLNQDPPPPLLPKKPAKAKAPPRRYKARVATKIKWALGDSMERTRVAQQQMKRLLDRLEEMRLVAESIAESSGDTRLLAIWGRANHEVAMLALNMAEMERIVRDAIDESKLEVKKPSYSAEQL